MEHVPTTQVRQNFAEYIRQVNEVGECIVITDYGKPVACLCPRPKTDDGVAVAPLPGEAHTL